VLCTASNRAGIKFDVANNVQYSDDGYVNLGKCAIRFIKPAKTIFVTDADPLLLKLLLKFLNKVLKAKTNQELDGLSLSSAALNHASIGQVYNLKEKIIINDKKDYPIKENFPKCTPRQNFPSSLKELRVNGINLKKFDNRMLKLSRLVVLDLADNNLKLWPESFGGLENLKELYLSNNKLTKVPVSLLLTVSKSLNLLDLSANQLSILPDVFSKLTSLVTLKLKNNQLKRLSVPFSVLKNLDTLELIGNPELGAMPQSFQKLQLNHLSISSKCLTTDMSGLIVEDTSSNFPLLTDLCLARLNKSGCRSKLDETCLPARLLRYWDTMEFCPCGALCLGSSLVRALVKVDPKRIAQNFTTDSHWLNWSAGMGSKAFLCCETVFCAPKCVDLYKNHWLL